MIDRQSLADFLEALLPVLDRNFDELARRLDQLGLSSTVKNGLFDLLFILMGIGDRVGQLEKVIRDLRQEHAAASFADTTVLGDDTATKEFPSWPPPVPDEPGLFGSTVIQPTALQAGATGVGADTKIDLSAPGISGPRMDAIIAAFQLGMPGRWKDQQPPALLIGAPQQDIHDYDPRISDTAPLDGGDPQDLLTTDGIISALIGTDELTPSSMPSAIGVLVIGDSEYHSVVNWGTPLQRQQPTDADTGSFGCGSVIRSSDIGSDPTSPGEDIEGSDDPDARSSEPDSTSGDGLDY